MNDGVGGGWGRGWTNQRLHDQQVAELKQTVVQLVS